MQAIVLLGARIGKDGDESGKRIVECLYCGFDGVALSASHKVALESGKGYYQFGKLTNPACTPLGVDTRPTIQTKPSFPRPKAFEAPAAKSTPTLVEKRDAATREENARKARLALSGGTPPLPPKLTQGALREDGPTLEEYVVAGHAPETYPPAGFAVKESAAYTAHLEAAQKKLNALK